MVTLSGCFVYGMNRMRAQELRYAWMVFAGVVLFSPAVRAGADADYRKVLSSFRAEDDAAAALVDAFIVAYPEDERLGQMQVLQLSAMFDAGDYAELVAKVQRDSLVFAGEQREAVAYMLAGAQCFSGDYKEAVVSADVYLAEWEAGKFAEDVRYFKAVSLARLGYVKEVRVLLEPMQAEDAEDFEFLDNAMYELALLDFNGGEHQASIVRLEELLTWLFDAPLEVEAQLLLAQNYAVVRQRKKAEKCFLKALTVAKDAELPLLKPKVLFYLVDFFGRETVAGEENSRIGEAVPYYREFFEKFPDSIYAAQVATAGLPALEAVGELRQGVDQLEAVVRLYCAREKEEGLRRAASSLIWRRLSLGETPVSLRKMLQEEKDAVFAAVMWHALSKVYDAGASQSRVKWGQPLRFRVLQESCFAELASLADRVNLPSYLRADLGWWFLEDGNFPALAMEQFKLAQNTQNGTLKELALVGEMTSLALLEGEQNLSVAQQALSQVVLRAEANLEVREKAMFHLITVMDLRGDWQELERLSYVYLYEEKMESERDRVHFFLAKSYDEQQKVEDAIAQYTNVVDYVWCQEEPQNQGAWYSSQHNFRAAIPVGADIQYAGRPASASPAVGYMSVHLKQQKALIEDALTIA